MIRVKSKHGRFIALLPDTLQGAFTVVATAWGVGGFAAQWPCSKLKEQPIVFDYSANGDLIGCGWSIQPDGEALLALSHDAQSFGEACLERRRARLGGAAV